MGYNEDLIQIRQRVSDLLNQGAITPNSKDFYEGTLIQVMNDAERNRQNCMVAAENLKRQVSMMEGQASGFAAVSSMVLAVLNGFVKKTEQTNQEVIEFAPKEIQPKEIIPQEEKPKRKRI